jgi:Ca2+:H+ antiporter
LRAGAAGNILLPIPNPGVRVSRLVKAGNALYLLLVFVPVALALEHLAHASPVLVFVASSLAIVPLAGVMGHATERIAERMGQGVGGLLNATFGNAAELIIALIALKAGMHDLVKASITGSIIGNVLLVFGLSSLAGGLRYKTQKFNATAASLGSTLLVLSTISLMVPAIFHMIVRGSSATANEQNLSFEIAVVLFVTYLLSLVFTLHTHSDLYRGHAGEDAAKARAPSGSVRRSVGVLLAATVGVAVMAELLVGAAEVTARQLGWNEVFVGVILVAVIGNAAEHSTAVMMAMKNKMDGAVNIAVGSSIQMALFVAPTLVFLSYFIGPHPMDLLFTILEILAIALSVGVIALISHDGESHWMEGVQLLAVYLILAIAFFWLP